MTVSYSRSLTIDSLTGLSSIESIELFDKIAPYRSLSIAHHKDVVEKGFDTMKNEIDIMPANVRKDSTMKGYLFICFLSLILRMRLMKLMREASLSSKYSIEALVTELEKNRVMILPDGTQIVTEHTKKQKEIFKGLCA